MEAAAQLWSNDKGPGIADIEQALKDGSTSGKGMGLGLEGAKRLCNEFSIASKLGEGTKVCIARWKIMKFIVVNDQNAVAEAMRTATDLAERTGFSETEKQGRNGAFDKPAQARLWRRNPRRHR
jgi:hypothetical protein